MGIPEEAEASRRTLLDSSDGVESDLGEEPVLAPGEVVDGHYLIHELLGRGAMGTVYRAQDLALGRDIALKVVRGSMLDHRAMREAFAAEARAMAQVRHPNVVTIHAFGEHRERPYLVMEYVSGVNLAQWQESRGTAAPSDAIGLIDALCRGVQAIHETGGLHRDLKPANVLIDGDGRVAVTDFGLSGTLGRETGGSSLAALGTPAYVSPEVARDDRIEPALAPRVDVYALGVIAFELLTGRRPFEAASVAGLLQHHAWTPPPRPSELREGLPMSFDRPLLRALAKSPSSRTPSADALRTELSEALEAETARPRRVMLVDDEPTALLALSELIGLTFPGVEVISVTNSDTAVTIATREPPDIIVCDLQMPSGGAVPLTKAIRADSRTCEVPIIVVTGHGGAEQWRELRALGADRFLVKPIDFQSLAATIRVLSESPR